MLISVLQILGLLSPIDVTSLVEQSNYLESYDGNTNLVLTSPHDGREEPTNIRDRKHGCRDRKSGNCEYKKEECGGDPGDHDICEILTKSDLNSSDVAKKVWNKYQEITGKRPHLILSLLHRSRLDLNRDLAEAAQGDKEAIKVYYAFHNKIKAVHSSFNKQPGLQIDFHAYGDSCKQKNIVLGYLLPKADLNNEQYNQPNKSSIRSLVQRSGTTFEEFLIGNISLGARLEKHGYNAVPSPRQPKPNEDKYYRGGYISKQYGSRDNGSSDSIQLEFPPCYKNSEERRLNLSVALANILAEFMEEYYTPYYHYPDTTTTWPFLDYNKTTTSNIFAST